MAVHDAYARLTPYELSFPELGFARTQLTRGQNRLVAALREARRVVDRATV